MDGTIGMTVLETDAFLLFITRHTSYTDLKNVAEILSHQPDINIDAYTALKEMKSAQVVPVLHHNTFMKKFKLSEVIEALYHKGYYSLAEKLYCCYLECQKSVSVLRMNKVQTENRRKISLYFKNIKKLVHEIAFKNPHADVKRLGKIMKGNIELESDSARKMFLCDKYVALKAAEMDALTNIAGTVSPYHEGYGEMESFITSTSNPSISQVILYGRRADAFSTIGQFEEGEDLLRAAYVSADSSGPCVEITDMIYKNVVFKLSQLERTPTEDLQKSLLLEASRGIWSLNEESEDMRVFWKRLFILRMVYSLLGIGKFCDMIQSYVPTQASLLEAERLLACDDLTNMEHRRMMFYYVAKSRLKQWKGEFDKALKCVKVARNLAKEGKYFEDRALIHFERELQNIEKSDPAVWDPISLKRPIVYEDYHDLSDVEISFNSIVISGESSSSSLDVADNSLNDS